MHINLKLCISARNYLPVLFTQQVTKGASGEFGQQPGREGLSPLPLPPTAGGWLGFVIICCNKTLTVVWSQLNQQSMA